jgi:hypothetical protein
VLVRSEELADELAAVRAAVGARVQALSERFR